MICSYCGTDLPLGAMFCGECGRPVAARAAVRTRSRSSANSVATSTRWPASVAEHQPDEPASAPSRPERRPADVDAAAHALVEPPRASDAVFADPPPSAAKAGAAARAAAKAEAADQAAADALERATAQAQADADARAAAEATRADAAAAARAAGAAAETQAEESTAADSLSADDSRAEEAREAEAAVQAAARDAELAAGEAAEARAAADEAAQAQAVADEAARALAAQEREAEEREAEERKARELAALEQAAREQAALEQAALEQAARERDELEQADERAALERAATERVALERAAAERAAVEQSAAERAAVERAAGERAQRDLAEALARSSTAGRETVGFAPPVVQDLVDAHEQVETCAQCGAQLAASDIFCGVCGFVRKPVAAAPTRPNDTVAYDPFPWGLPRAADVVPLALAPEPPDESYDDDSDIEKTRIVDRSVRGDRFVLQFSTGESVSVSGTGLIGRNPVAEPGEYFDSLVTIVDPGKSVSKTHLEFGQDAGAFWVSDRYSANGTVLREPDRPARRGDAGKRYRVVRGTRVDIGEQFFIVS